MNETLLCTVHAENRRMKFKKDCKAKGMAIPTGPKGPDSSTLSK